MHRIRIIILVIIAGIMGVQYSTAFNDPPETAPNSERHLAISNLDRRITEAEARIKSIDDAYRLILNIAQIAVVIGGLIGLFLMIERWKDRKRSEEEASRTREWYEQLMSRQETSNNKLFDSVQANIDEASSLFGALKDMLSLQKDAQQIEQDLLDKQQQVRSGIVQDLNAEANFICGKVTRANYASIDLQEVIHEYATKLKQYAKEYVIEDCELGAASFFILGIDLHVRNLDDRLKLIERSCEAGKRDLQSIPSEKLRIDMSVDVFRTWTKARINEAYYHLAIVLYNVGEYRQAISKFQEAIQYDAHDISSMLYIPEAKFLGFLENNFNNIVAEFEAIIDSLQNDEYFQHWPDETRTALLSLALVRLGNCYYARSKYEPYRAYRSLQNATDHFLKAKELCPTSYLARFSYAQALKSWASQLPTTTPGRRKLESEAEALFESVFSIIRDKLSTTSEAKIRMMLFYMLAICAKEGKIRGELPQAYIAHIYSEKGNLGVNSRLRIFSPRTKNDLSIDEFILEIESFQRHI